jgi:hypothetical protein
MQYTRNHLPVYVNYSIFNYIGQVISELGKGLALVVK